MVKKHGLRSTPYGDEYTEKNKKEELDAIRQGKARLRFIPVVDDKKNMNLLFMVRIEEL
mgnify:CR=1 FL=1